MDTITTPTCLPGGFAEYIEVGRKLPCGHLLIYRITRDRDKPPTDLKLLDTMVATLDCLHRGITERHSCELVSDENPNGITPRS